MEPTPGSHPESASSTPPSQPSLDEQRHEVEVLVRRSPKYGPFMAIGAVLGALAMWIIGLLMPPGVNAAGQQVDTLPVVGLAIVLGFAVGAGLGGLVAVLLDRRLSKRASTFVAEQTDVAEQTFVAEQQETVEQTGDDARDERDRPGVA